MRTGATSKRSTTRDGRHRHYQHSEFLRFVKSQKRALSEEAALVLALDENAAHVGADCRPLRASRASVLAPDENSAPSVPTLPQGPTLREG